MIGLCRPFRKTKAPPPEEPSVQSELILIYPVSVRDGKTCRATPWGDEGYQYCPFLRRGYCRFWGFDTARRPDKIAACSLTQVVARSVR